MQLHSKYSKILVIDAVLFVVSIVPFLLNHNQAIRYSPYNYFMMQFLIVGLLFSIDKPNRNRFLLSPSFIAVSYLNVNFLIGSVVFMKGLVYEFVLVPYHEWDHVNISTGYFNLINFFIINTFFVSKKLHIPKFKIFYDAARADKKALLITGVVLLAIFSFVGIDLSFFSSSPADFYIIPKSLGAIMIFVVLFNNYKLKYRIICYALIIVVFAVSSYEDKRDAIFLTLPILLLESTRFELTLDVKKLILFSFSAIFLSYLIMVMSILRGYGQFKPNGFLDATQYVDEYIRSTTFIPSFMNNIEVSYTYFHSNNAIEKIIEDPGRMSYGSTIIKPLFILVPREFFPGKPSSIIDLYTRTFSLEMRREGFSAPISFQSEMFWNFHVVGIAFGAIFFFIFNSVYLNIVNLIHRYEIINYVPLLYIYQQSLVMFRGSGLDQYIIDIILSFIIFTLVKIVLRLLVTRKRVRSKEHFAGRTWPL